MNYLAHLFLAEDSADSILGNFLGDFVKGPLEDGYRSEIIKGIITHRKVDSFTDSHERVLSSKKLISQGRRRFAGIIVDMSFDHFLARNWNDYSSLNLNVFIKKAYDLLERYKNILPQKLQSVIPRIIGEDWLGSYRNIDGIGAALNKISRRFKRENNLAGAVEELVSNYEVLEENFRVFFPELIVYVEDYRKITYKPNPFSSSLDPLIKTDC
ncbi:MAG TPA: ACP phosphodiesterase [Thermodesulfobacteriota bacterium]|jgi:acyl carrier protein phosphodiesterase